MRETLLKIWVLVSSWFPSPLPRNSEEFDAFSKSVLEIYDLPDNESYRHSIAVMIQHLPPTQVYKSKRWFAHSLYNAQSREVAFYKIREFQEKEKAKDAGSDVK